MKKSKMFLPEDEGKLKRNDSFRKILPTKPSASVDSRLSMSGRMVERPSAGIEKGAKLYTPFILEYALLAEFLKFQKREIAGLYVNPADKDPLLWYGVLFLHQGLYQGGVFRFTVHFPSYFPEGDCPRVVFDGGIFHPAISPETGDLNVAAEFRKWRKTVNHVWQVLQYAKDVFIQIDTKVPLNIAAGQLLVDDPVGFQQQAQSCAASSRAMLYVPSAENDLNYIRFEPYSEDLHGPVRDILGLKSTQPPSDS